MYMRILFGGGEGVMLMMAREMNVVMCSLWLCAGCRRMKICRMGS